ncbi:MAG: dTDP-4-dehydrorhamnose reductase [Betaproteobacteria bacterium]|nr:dTDP-4-dehydrorhamnose reductase [Betaproteobacteria bacterium]
MRILLTGRNGQVGWELERTLPPLGEVIATDRATLDLSKPDAIRRVVREAKPDLIVYAAAYTAVDKAESEPELAHAINATAPGVLAEEAKRLGALLVHYSTDYVFDGCKTTPYVEDDAPNPLNVYGASKLAGERAIQASSCRHLIFRTSWVYGARGHNFLLTILRAAREKPELRVVDDQLGAPTWCREIARATADAIPLALADPSKLGLYHASCTGATSWFGFAVEILRVADIPTRVHAIASSQHPTAALRPANSRLSNVKLATTLGIALGDWRESLARCMREIQTKS